MLLIFFRGKSQIKIDVLTELKAHEKDNICLCLRNYWLIAKIQQFPETFLEIRKYDD